MYLDAVIPMTVNYMSFLFLPVSPRWRNITPTSTLPSSHEWRRDV